MNLGWLENLENIQLVAVQTALSGVLIGAGVLAAARLCRRRSEAVQYAILLGGVIGLLASPALVGVGHGGAAWTDSAGPAPAAEIVRIPADLLPAFLDGQEQAPLAAEENSSAVLGPALVLLWIAGAVLGLARFVRAWRKQMRALVGQAWSADFWTAALQDRLAHMLGLRRFPDVLLAPAAPMPMVVGLWRPRIFLPEVCPATWRQPQWEAVLLHEAAHVARRDPWALLAQRLAAILFWWCPFTHVLNRRLDELREHICDACALQGPCDRVGYAELLIETAECLLNLKKGLVPLGLLSSDRSGLEARITRLLDKERPMTKLAFHGKALGAATLLAACLVATAGTAFSGGPAQPQKKVQIKIIVNGKELDLSDADLWKHLATAPKKTIVKDAPLADKPPVETRPVQRLEVVVPAVKADPRIDELVKQAEAIKPGSGAAIRRALQGEANLSTSGMRLTLVPEKTPPAAPAYRLTTVTPAKKTIALSVPDGGVVQLREEELPKVMGGSVRSSQSGPNVQVIETAPGKQVIIITIDGKAQVLGAQIYEKFLNKDAIKKQESDAKPKPPADKPAAATEQKTAAHLALERALRHMDTKAAPNTGTTDIDTLRRQIESLAADLQELRKRLDAGKK